MGYSCTTKAMLTLECIMEELRKNSPINSSNSWIRNERFYFFERGRENDDGAITGTIWKSLIGSPNVHKSGSFRIEPNGTVTRFPTLTKQERQTAEERAQARYNNTYSRNASVVVNEMKG